MNRILTWRNLAVVGAWALASLAVSAYAEQMVFLRVNDLGALMENRIQTDYSVEMGRRYSSDRSDFRDPIRYRLRVGAAANRWLKFSAIPTIRHQTDTNETKLSSFVPEARIVLGPLLGGAIASLPMETELFTAARFRITGRRDSSLVMGLGLRALPNRLSWATNVGLEVTFPDADSTLRRQIGTRYDGGLSYLLASDIRLATELWGHVDWDSRGYYVEQEHHMGPAVSYEWESARIGLLAYYGIKDNPGVAMTHSYNGVLQLKLEL